MGSGSTECVETESAGDAEARGVVALGLVCAGLWAVRLVSACEMTALGPSETFLFWALILVSQRFPQEDGTGSDVAG